MTVDEDSLLQSLYVEANIPTDQYARREAELRTLVDTWNTLCGRSESHTDLLHYMMTQRKNKKWVTLGRSECEKMKDTAAGLSAEELLVLDKIHEDLQISSDRFALDSELAEQLKKEFALRTGRVFPAMLLAAAMIRRRKVGKLETLKPTKESCSVPFSDFDKVASSG